MTWPTITWPTSERIAHALSTIIPMPMVDEIDVMTDWRIRFRRTTWWQWRGRRLAEREINVW